MKKLFLTLLLGGFSTPFFAQTARVQVIHNSADAATDTVDVYLNGTLLLNNFAFRNASPFIDAPAGTKLQVAFAPKTSTSVNDTIAGLTSYFTLTTGSTYVLVADGIVSATGYTPKKAFEIKVYALGREASKVAGKTDVLVHHGSTDAPTVDVKERTAGVLVNDASYGDFAGYLELTTANYTLDVQDAAGTTTVASYSAPLATLGLTNKAIVVVASGFLDPTKNSNGKSFGLWVALPTGGKLVALPTAPAPIGAVARVQVIHNSADAAAKIVDVYLNGTLLLNDFSFRTASPFVDVPANKLISIAIAPKTSTSINDTIPGLTFKYNLLSGATYVLIADGIVSSTGYTPKKPFEIKVYGMGREASSTSGNTDVLIHHGSTDAPTVDVNERTAGRLVNNASYGNFAGYLELPTTNYTIDVKNEDGTSTVASYSAPLLALNLTNKAIVVVASGFIDSTKNSNGSRFGLWVALPTGGNLVALPVLTPPSTGIARVQVIHNSADAAAQIVDVYLNGALLLNDFMFRTATPFVDLPSGTPLSISIAPKNSTSINDTIAGLTSKYNLTAGLTYVLVADGIVSTTGYNPRKPFGIKVYALGREASKVAGKTDVLVHHGSTDAPTVDVKERTAGLLVNNASYGDFAGYLELATANYTLDVQDAAGTTTVASYSAPLATLGLTNKAIVVVASGFLNPAQNANGSEFGLWVALPTGGDLVALPKADANSINEYEYDQLKVYPNPTSNYLTIDNQNFSSSNVRITDLMGREVGINLFSIENNRVDVSNLMQGVYQLDVFEKNKIVGRVKFIKL